MFEEQTFEAIMQRLLNRVSADIDKSEGSFIYDALAPAALELAQAYIQLDNVLQLTFVQTSYGEWLDKRAAEFGIKRKLGDKSIGQVTFIGNDFTIIPKGTLVQTGGGLQFTTVDDTQIINESATVNIEAVEVGAEYNLPANAITTLPISIAGIISVTNNLPTIGGTDIEDDDALRERVLEYARTQGASFIGNLSDYIRWAKEVDGVGSVIAIEPTEDDGIIRLIVSDMVGNPATSELCEDVYNHIMRPDSPENRLAPINAYLEVTPPEVVVIDISATIEASTDVNIMVENFKQLLKEYFQTTITEGEVKYSKVGALLLDVTGIVDYNNLLLNGGTENIPITKTQCPTVGNVVLLI